MIATILVTALALWGGMFLMRKGDYGSVRITVNGLEYGTYSLAKDQVIAIGDTNVCEIKMENQNHAFNYAYLLKQVKARVLLARKKGEFTQPMKKCFQCIGDNWQTTVRESKNK